jgi:hypothetical protein
MPYAEREHARVSAGYLKHTVLRACQLAELFVVAAYARLALALIRHSSCVRQAAHL